ncbi:MAG: hypothetical protein AAF559_04125 [Pseudomonadota bacterium]
MSRKDIDAVLNDGISAAVHFIEKSGEFFPFGVVKTIAGEIRHIQTLMPDALPTSDTVSEALETSLKEGADIGEYNTVAIVSNVEVTDKKMKQDSMP